MTTLFSTILRIGFLAGLLVPVILLLRLLFRKQSKLFRLALWTMLAVRLLLPKTIESPLSIVPDVDSFYNRQYEGVAYESETDTASTLQFTELIQKSNKDSLKTLLFLSVLWGMGVAVMMTYFLIAQIVLYSKTRFAVHKCENIYYLPKGSAAFVRGFLRPRIYIPEGCDSKTERHILSHEKAHIAFGDHIAKPVAFVFLSVYWFHPLLWLSYYLFCKDLELLCDERVTRKLSPQDKADYVLTLLFFIHNQKHSSIVTGFTGIRNDVRVRSIIEYKKPTISTVVVLLTVLIATGVTCMTCPVENQNETPVEAKTGFVEDDVSRINEMKVTYPELFSMDVSKGVIVNVIPKYGDRYEFYIQQAALPTLVLTEDNIQTLQDHTPRAKKALLLSSKDTKLVLNYYQLDSSDMQFHMYPYEDYTYPDYRKALSVLDISYNSKQIRTVPISGSVSRRGK